MREDLLRIFYIENGTVAEQFGTQKVCKQCASTTGGEFFKNRSPLLERANFQADLHAWRQPVRRAELGGLHPAPRAPAQMEPGKTEPGSRCRNSQRHLFVSSS